MTLWSTCQHPFLVRAEIADLFGLPLSRVRVIVPYLGGGFGSKSYTKMEPVTVALARKAGRPVRIVNRVDESMATTRRHGADITMRTAADADGRLLARDVDVDVRHRRLRRQRAARGRHRRGRRPRAVPLVGRPRARRLRPHEHRAVGLVPRVRGVAPPVGRRAPGRRGRPPRRPRPAGDAPAQPAAAGRGRAPRRQAPRRRPRGRRREGSRGARLGRATPEGHGRGLSVGLLAAGAHPVSSAVVRLEVRRRGGRPRRLDRDGPGPAHGLRADRGRGARPARRARPLPRHRHAVHALRPLDRRQPLDDAGRAGRPAGRAGGPRGPPRDRPLDLARRRRRAIELA